MPEANANPTFSGDLHSLTLPVSGLIVLINRTKFRVRENDKAVLMCGDKKTTIRISAAKMSLRVKHADGRAILMEEILDWWEDDFNAINELWGEEDFTITPMSSSSSSLTSPAGDSVNS